MRTCPLNSSLFLSWLRSIWMVREPLDVVGGDSDRAASYQEQMSQLGQSRHFDRALLTSGLPRLADILRVIRHVSKVPKGGILAQRYMVALASPPDVSPCVCEFWTLGIGVLRDREQLTVIHGGLVAIACGLCGARGAVVSSKAVRFALLRCFILLERQNWLAGLIQH